MKLPSITLILATLAGCATDPTIVPDPTTDNVVMLEIKDRIAQPGGTQPTYGWLFWYGPVALMMLMWGYRNLIRKPIDCIEQEPDSAKVQKTIDDNVKT